MQDGEFVSESVSSSVSSSDSSSHYPQALSHALSMLGLPELLLKEEQKLARICSCPCSQGISAKKIWPAL